MAAQALPAISETTAVGTTRLVLATDSFLPHAGGSRVYYYELYKNLVERHPYNVTVMTGKVSGWEEFDQHEQNERFRIQRPTVPMVDWRIQRLPQMMPAMAHLYRELGRGQCDQLHCGDLFPQALGGALAHPFWRKPLLIFCHGDEISQTNQRRLQPKIRDRVYRQAGALVAANEFARKALLALGVEERRIFKILPGVNSHRFKPSPRRSDLIEKFGLANRPVILTAARLVPRKGVQTILAAMPEILRECPSAKYLIVGDGPQRQELEASVQQMGIGEAVVFAGNVPPSEMSDYYNLCDVFAMANRTEAGGDIESFGMVFVEANAHGKPAIGGRSGGTDEAIVEGKTGFLCESDDPAAFAKAIKSLLRDHNLRNTLGANGLARVLTDFRWTSRADQFHEVLNLLSQREGAR